MFRVQFFEQFPKELTTSISERMVCKTFKTGKKRKYIRQSLTREVMKKDEIGDCMYIIIQGECGVYLHQDEFAN